ncbi:MAG TPA: adenylate/guanylate cyclase domain-containing protein, partial [Ramlibacter sp.]
LDSAMLLRDLLVQRRALQVRIGLHMGPVRIISDINSRTNVVGDGINVAQRIMDFARSNQVLVSRAYYDVISRITDGTADLFQFMGQYEDKHGRLHEVYAVAHQRGATPTTRREGPTTGYTHTAPAQPAAALAEDGVHEIEAELARHIGPLAKVLARKAAPLAPSLQALRESLAATIPDTKAREAFIAGATSPSHPVSVPVSGKRSTTRPPSVSGLAPSVPVVSRSSNKSVPFGAAPKSQPGSQSRVAPHPQLDLHADEAALIEQHLSKYIGPMARMLVRKEATKHPNFNDFIGAVAGNIDQPPERDQFLIAVRKALPRRH